MPSHPKSGIPARKPFLARRKLLEPVPIVRQFRQNLFHLRHDIVLIRKRHLVPYLWMNDISGSAEVRDHRYGTSARELRKLRLHHCREEMETRTHQQIAGA